MKPIIDSDYEEPPLYLDDSLPQSGNITRQKIEN
jgi:hypothetical protein